MEALRVNLPLGLLSPVLIIVIIGIFPVWQAGVLEPSEEN